MSADSGPLPRPVRRSAELDTLRPGSHLCSLYASAEQLEHVANRFTGAGLAAGDRVMYVASERTPTGVVAGMQRNGIPAASALASGQLVMAVFADAYGTGALDDTEVAAGFRASSRQARDEGFPGLRVVAEMGGVLAALGSAERVLRWERTATALQRDELVSSVCAYDADRTGERLAAELIAEHEDVLTGDGPVPVGQFLATTQPWGVRVVGEVDLANRRLLARALEARIAVSPVVHLDVAELSFIDVGGLETVWAIARRLPPDGYLYIRNASNHVRDIVDLVALSHPQVGFA